MKSFLGRFPGSMGLTPTPYGGNMVTMRERCTGLTWSRKAFFLSSSVASMRFITTARMDGTHGGTVSGREQTQTRERRRERRRRRERKRTREFQKYKPQEDDNLGADSDARVQRHPIDETFGRCPLRKLRHRLRSSTAGPHRGLTFFEAFSAPLPTTGDLG